MCFQYARRFIETEEWMQKGESILLQMTCWNEHSVWNFESKMYLLEAEKTCILGQFDQAEHLYVSAIRSAQEHKFIHEEACASELAGLFFYQRGFHQKSHELLMHSKKCYETWGAFAVSKRVEAFIASKFGLDFYELEAVDDTIQSFFDSEDGSSNKRIGD